MGAGGQPYTRIGRASAPGTNPGGTVGGRQVDWSLFHLLPPAPITKTAVCKGANRTEAKPAAAGGKAQDWTS